MKEDLKVAVGLSIGYVIAGLLIYYHFDAPCIDKYIYGLIAGTFFTSIYLHYE